MNAATDRYQWMQETAGHLRAGEPIDQAELADWLDEMSRSDRREVSSRLRRIIEHRLKLDYVTGVDLAQNARGWKRTINDQVNELADIFDESPSLRHALTPALLAKSYAAVKANVADEYRISLPGECPYTYDQLI